MATKKTVEVEDIAEATVEDVAAEKTAEEKLKEAQKAARAPVKVAEEGDPNMDLQSILIPVNPANKNDTHLTVGLNGKYWTLERGKTVVVPKAVVEIIEHAQMADAEAMAYIREHAEN